MSATVALKARKDSLSPGTQLRHPRRMPAHQSVSLRHDKANGEQRPMATASTPFSLQNLNHSSEDSSNAESWFERSNNTVRVKHSNSTDSEPPFFIQTSSEHSPAQLVGGISGQPGISNIPPRLQNFTENGSSSDGFRSVIDDLTIENKKLRRRLRKLEKMHDVNLHSDRLFEVRMHGLSAGKKRELEETLKRFVLSLNEPTMPQGSTPQYLPYPGLKLWKTNSMSDSKFNDSAYASLSASGRTSIAPSGRESHRHSQHPTVSRVSSNNQTIQSYLHDIPECLLPTPSQSMSEGAKKKLVVGRLEHIFAGRSADGAHQQPLHQQEVSQSAAHADRVAHEATGQRAVPEGIREAHIMPDTPTDQRADMAGFSPAVEQKNSDASANANGPARGNDKSSNVEGDQRPTRPLDLDPNRAQVAAENLQYMRHLGFSPDARRDGHGWIYINLLINMAQLHTINVTTDFVRDAVLEYGDQFEMSHDGRKLRWKGAGGNHVSDDSSEGGLAKTKSSRDVHDLQNEGPQRKRRRVQGQQSNAVGSSLQAWSSPVPGVQHMLKKKLAYTPLFSHERKGDSESIFTSGRASGSPSVFVDDAEASRSGYASGELNGATSRVKSDAGGPIIFYNKAPFWIDLSADQRHNAYVSLSNISYNRCTKDAVGVDARLGCFDSAEYSEPRGRLAHTPQLEAFTGADASGMSLRLDSPQTDGAPAQQDVLMSDKVPEFEACGLGGVKPADHFAVGVSIRRRITQSSAHPHRSTAKCLAPRLAPLFADPQTLPSTTKYPALSVADEIIATRTTSLPPSALPQPNYFFDPLDDDDDDDASGSASDSATASSCSHTALTDHTPGLAHHPAGTLSSAASAPPIERAFSFGSAADADDAAYDDEDDDDDDGSLDLLAAAREADPEAIRIQEREYDSGVAERLAEGVPAGSSAATAGGGSGWGSAVGRRGKGPAAVGERRGDGTEVEGCGRGRDNGSREGSEDADEGSASS